MKISLYDEEFDYSLEDETLSLEKVIKEFYDLSSEKASFFQMKTEKSNTVQIAWEYDDIWLIDIPIKLANEDLFSLQKYANYEECIDIISSVDKNKKIKNLFKVYILESTLEETIHSIKPISKYSFDLENNDNIAIEFTYDGWERGLFLYWSYKNNLLIEKVNNIISLQDLGLENMNQSSFYNILTNIFNIEFNIDIYKKDIDFINEYFLVPFEDINYFNDIEMLFSDINNTLSIHQDKNSYEKLLNMLDNRYGSKKS
ncbi:hypothetical protein [Halarcobacter sp.]|uniref:hypothetical protein n=1 Tax=Halarcobacter sp. TaxID=2321133 RepID=UPI0029F4A8CB|nr:hypothetical protein [Halarcobacter sp.]